MTKLFINEELMIISVIAQMEVMKLVIIIFYSATNACENGVFYCRNRFYLPKNISTSKVNDAICDCCDGSDEIKTKNCPQSCIELSKKDFKILLEKFNKIKSSTKSLTSSNQFEDNLIEKTNSIIKTYKELEELNENHFLILSYLTKLRKKIGEEEFDNNFNFIDEHQIILKDLKDSLNKLGEKIYEKEQYLEINGKYINQLLLLITFQINHQECLSTTYKNSNINACLDKGIEMNARNSWHSINLGYIKAINSRKFSKLEDNVLYYINGDSCGNYNKMKSSKIILECGTEEAISFERKINYCEYEFRYKTRFGCNYMNLLKIKNTILVYLKEI